MYVSYLIISSHKNSGGQAFRCEEMKPLDQLGSSPSESASHASKAADTLPCCRVVQTPFLNNSFQHVAHGRRYKLWTQLAIFSPKRCICLLSWCGPQGNSSAAAGTSLGGHHSKQLLNPTPSSGKIQHNSSLQHWYVSFVDSFNGGGLVIDFQLMIIVVSRKTTANTTPRVTHCWYTLIEGNKYLELRRERRFHDKSLAYGRRSYLAARFGWVESNQQKLETKQKSWG